MHSRKRIRASKSIQAWRRQVRRLQSMRRTSAMKVGAASLLAVGMIGTVTLLARHGSAPQVPSVRPQVSTHDGADVNETPAYSASASQTAAKPRQQMVTVTGCLVRDNDSF